MYRATEHTKANAQRRHDAITEAARQQIIEGGFRSATVKAVARRAGCSTGLIYQYFPNAEALLKGAFAHIAKQELAVFHHVLHSSPDIETALAYGIETAVRRALAGPRQADALLFEALPQLVEEERLVFRRHWAYTLSQRLDRGIADGQLPSQDTQFIGTAIMGAIIENLLPRLHTTTATRHTNQPPDVFIAALQDLSRRIVGLPQQDNHRGAL
ncbi:MAG TPA: TetR/AcrR family transcriptional regulator [Enteractinococcus sp.]